MDERQDVPLGDVESVAIEMIRRARRTCEQIGGLGYRFMGVADWLELQVPRVRTSCRSLMGAFVDGFMSGSQNKN
jgi:hypothetical protein